MSTTGGTSRATGRPEPVRVVLGVLGVLVVAYGAWLLLSRQDLAQIRSVAFWLAGGVLAHDVLVAAVTLLAGVLARRVLPGRLRAPVVAGAVVLASLTLMAVPVLGRFGARSDNPSLLDRHYVLGWLVLAVLVALGVGVGVLRRHRVPRG